MDELIEVDLINRVVGGGGAGGAGLPPLTRMLLGGRVIYIPPGSNQLLWAAPDDFKQLLAHPCMLEHHMPYNYYGGLQRWLRETADDETADHDDLGGTDTTAGTAAAATAPTSPAAPPPPPPAPAGAALGGTLASLVATVPAAASAGQQVYLKHPVGKLFKVQIPAGIGPGDQFLVQLSA